MKFGGHVSASGGLYRAVERGVEITTDCLQIFVTSPQQWKPVSHSDEEVEKYRAVLATSGLAPVIFHAQYLINIASPDPALRKKSADALVSQVEWADRLGAMGVVFHPGSSVADPREVGMEHAVETLADILARASGAAALCLETTAGSGNTIGSRFEDLGTLIDRLDKSPRLQVCLDTCHIFAAGYPCRTAAELDDTMAQFDRAIGLDRLTSIHLNDSKGAFGSHKDRHDNIGDGEIGYEGFRAIVNYPAFASLPGFLEVPGIEGEGPDRENLDRLRRLVQET
jgi:deoxyribonuclease-4